MSNNRFAALLEGTTRDPYRKKGFSNQDSGPHQRLNRERRDRYEYYNQSSKSNRTRPQVIPKDLFSASDFPDMLRSPSKDMTNKSTVTAMNYLNTVQSKEDEEIQIEQKAQLPPGWIELGKDSHKNKINLQSNQLVNELLNSNNNSDFIFTLNDKYINWFDNYIENWGYEEYETNYCFPNYDYDYFDKLDLEWLQQYESSSDDESYDYDLYDD